MAYLQVPLLLQAALGAWFFGSTESAGTGATVGVLALLGAAAFCRRGQPGLRRALPARLMANERGVRLTMLRPQVAGGGGGGTVEGGGIATEYALMTT